MKENTNFFVQLWRSNMPLNNRVRPHFWLIFEMTNSGFEVLIFKTTSSINLKKHFSFNFAVHFQKFRKCSRKTKKTCFHETDIQLDETTKNTPQNKLKRTHVSKFMLTFGNVWFLLRSKNLNQNKKELTHFLNTILGYTPIQTKTLSTVFNHSAVSKLRLRKWFNILPRTCIFQTRIFSELSCYCKNSGYILFLQG